MSHGLFQFGVVGEQCGVEREVPVSGEGCDGDARAIGTQIDGLSADHDERSSMRSERMKRVK
jgi:hypothetical protein